MAFEKLVLLLHQVMQLYQQTQQMEQPTAGVDPAANQIEGTTETGETPADATNSTAVEVVEEPVNLQEQYADYESFTLFIGISLSVFGLVPFLIFLYPVWFGISSAHQ